MSWYPLLSCRTLGYSDEQFDRIARGLIALLGHSDADHRLPAATVLGELGRETKVVDVALLDSFLNDPRVRDYPSSIRVSLISRSILDPRAHRVL